MLQSIGCADDPMDGEGRVPTVGALGDAGAVAEAHRPRWMRFTVPLKAPALGRHILWPYIAELMMADC
ncbi:hypothetical protein V2P20_06945 [Methylobacter sp. Wu1]|uniref:hypothetical protein n=1 Tax=Methylobacter sp. Wu1 TaxID=3119359 RepID=UPI002F93CA79